MPGKRRPKSRSVTRTPGQARAEKLRSEAHAALSAGDHQRAIELLREVLKHLPSDLPARTGLVMALMEMGEIGAAEEQLEEIGRRHPGSVEAHTVAGELYEKTRHPAAAARRFEKAAKLAAEPAGSLARQAGALERLHRLGDAREAAARALALEPEEARAHLVEGLLAARSQEYEKAVGCFGRLVTSPATPDTVRIRAGYERARALDRLGRYDEVMATLGEIKALQKSDCHALLRRAESVNRQNERLGAEITADDFAPLGQVPEQSLAVLIGFPRTGTTLLESALDRHPVVVCAEETPALPLAIVRPLLRTARPGQGPLEILRQLTTEAGRHCRDQYLHLLSQFLREPIGERLLLDKNPAYTHLLPFLKRLFPSLRTITALRDPRDVVLSCYMMSSLTLNEFNVSFLDLEETAQQYVRTMQAWRRYRDLLEDDFVEVRYEDLVADLRGELERVIAHLGLPWCDGMLGFQERAKEKPAQSPTYADVTQPIYTRAVQRWRNYEAFLEPVLPILEPMLATLGYE